MGGQVIVSCERNVKKQVLYGFYNRLSINVLPPPD